MHQEETYSVSYKVRTSLPGRYVRRDYTNWALRSHIARQPTEENWRIRSSYFTRQHSIPYRDGKSKKAKNHFVPKVGGCTTTFTLPCNNTKQPAKIGDEAPILYRQLQRPSTHIVVVTGSCRQSRFLLTTFVQLGVEADGRVVN